MAFSEKLLNPGEHVVVSTRTHPKVLLLPVLILVLTLGVAAFAQRTGSGGAADVMHIGVWVVAAFVIVSGWSGRSWRGRRRRTRSPTAGSSSGPG